MHSRERVEDVTLIFRFIPEEEFSLSELLLTTLGSEDRFKSVGVKAGVVGFGGNRHRSRSEILHLLKVEIKSFGDSSEFCHVFLGATRVRRYEVGDNLLIELLLLINAVENALKLTELLERGFAHKIKDSVGGVLGCNFQTP